LSVRGIQKIITGYSKKTGVKRKRVTAYSLRHSAATLALQNGASLMAIGDMLRHKSISTKQQYEHLTRRIEDGAEHYGDIQGFRKKIKLHTIFWISLDRARKILYD
jgi:integrase